MRKIEYKSQISPDLSKRKEINPLDLQRGREQSGLWPGERAQQQGQGSILDPKRPTDRSRHWMKWQISWQGLPITRRQAIKTPKLPSQRDHKSLATGKNLQLSVGTFLENLNPTARLLSRGKSKMISWKRRIKENQNSIFWWRGTSPKREKGSLHTSTPNVSKKKQPLRRNKLN